MYVLTWKYILRGGSQLCQFLKGERYKQVLFLEKVIQLYQSMSCKSKKLSTIYLGGKEIGIWIRCEGDFWFFLLIPLIQLEVLTMCIHT